MESSNLTIEWIIVTIFTEINFEGFGNKVDGVSDDSFISILESDVQIVGLAVSFVGKVDKDPGIEIIVEINIDRQVSVIFSNPVIIDRVGDEFQGGWGHVE